MEVFYVEELAVEEPVVMVEADVTVLHSSSVVTLELSFSMEYYHCRCHHQELDFSRSFSGES